MNPSQAYWNARAMGANVETLDRLNDARVAFERPMSVTQFVSMCAESNIECPAPAATQAEVDNESV